MPMVYPNEGVGGPSGALDALRRLGSLDATNAGSRGPINEHRLTETPIPAPAADGSYGHPAVSAPLSWPPPATPPAEISGLEHIVNSLKMAYGVPPDLSQHTVRGVKTMPDTPKLEQ